MVYDTEFDDTELNIVFVNDTELNICIWKYQDYQVIYLKINLSDFFQGINEDILSINICYFTHNCCL